MRAYTALVVIGVKFVIRDPLTILFTYAFPIVFLTLFTALFAIVPIETGLDESPIQHEAPGLLGFGLAMSSVFAAAVTISAWRGNGLLRRLRIIPITAGTILGSRITVSVLMSLVQGVIFVAYASLPFMGFELAATWGWALLPFLIAIPVFFLLGAVIGSIFKSEQSVMGAANLVVLPLGFISGSFIPLTGMPDWVHAAVSWSPLYQLNNSLQATLNEGRGLDAVLLPTAIIAAAGILLFAIAARTFHWVGRNE